MPMAINAFQGPDDLLLRVEDALQAADRACRFLPVEPQPSTDHLVLLAAPDSAEHMFLVPVCIQLQADLLKLQLLAKPVFLAGLQETRLPEDGSLPDPDFFMLHAACCGKGLFGVALWINKRFAYAEAGSSRYYIEAHL